MASINQQPGEINVTFTHGDFFSKLITITEMVPPAITYTAKVLTSYEFTVDGDIPATITAVDLAEGKINLTIESEDTASLEPGNYSILLKWTDTSLASRTFLKILIKLL